MARAVALWLDRLVPAFEMYQSVNARVVCGLASVRTATMRHMGRRTEQVGAIGAGERGTRPAERPLLGMNPSPEPTDRELWRCAVEGEPESFGLIFDRHSRSVHAYCARRTGSVDAADDLTSIVFLEAWRRRSEIDLYEESALPWLFGVANRVVRNRLRTTLRHRGRASRLVLL